MLNWLALSVALLAVIKTHAAIKWDFHTETLNQLLVKATIGTPGQDIWVELQPARRYDLVVPTPNAVYENHFDGNVSSTYTSNGDLVKCLVTGHSYPDCENLTVGWKAVDIATIGGTKVGINQFELWNSWWNWGTNAVVGLSRSNDPQTPTFIESVLKQQSEKITVLKYDTFNVDNQFQLKATGSLTIGGRPNGCSSKWSKVAEVPFAQDDQQQWAVAVDKLEVGKTRFASPGSTIFSFDENISLVLPQKVLDNLLKTLGADAQKQVPCSITTELVFTIGGAQLKLKPSDYLNIDTKMNLCTFRGSAYYTKKSKYADAFILPAMILKDQCIMYDFVNKQVGFADNLH